MNYLGYSEKQLVDMGAVWTAREIAQQPRVWRQVLADTAPSAQVEQLLAMKDLRILLTGAGSSAYIGECLAPAVQRRTGRRVDAVPTTDLVSGAERYFQRGVPTLMVSFARSGSSPESVAAVRMADEFIDQCYHVVLTCNEEGELCRLARSMPNAEALLMPRETHDRSFAMTSSFTSLLLAAARLFGVVGQAVGGTLAASTGAGDILSHGLDLAHELASSGFERVIYVGSNELKGLAREGALKLLELTDGRVVASFDSSLGLRHGPKTIVNGSTLIVMFVSNDPYTRRYDLDLLNELRSEKQAGRIIGLFGNPDGTDGHGDDVVVHGLADANDIEAALAFAVFAQVLAMFHSLRLALTPDNPSVSGTVNRIVRGVTIYRPQD